MANFVVNGTTLSSKISTLVDGGAADDYQHCFFLCGSYFPEAIKHGLRKDREHEGGTSLILKVRRYAE